MVADLAYLIAAMRPKQWVKNLFIFAGLIFSHNLFQGALVARVSAGFVLFCMAASSMYLFNDIRDLKEDLRNPAKLKRPLAAGLLSVKEVLATSVGLASAALAGALWLGTEFFYLVGAYLVLNFFYTLWLKRAVILDIMCIAFGFVLRVLAGTTLAEVSPSDWLIICTLTISMFLGCGKRRQEIALMGAGANSQRSVLNSYSVQFLDQMIAVATACTVMSYALYTISPETVARFGTRNLVFTIPFVLYGIYRYLYLVHQKATGDNPTSAVLSDVPLLVNSLLWLAAVVAIIY